jgi:hypothetical protein
MRGTRTEADSFAMQIALVGGFGFKRVAEGGEIKIRRRSDSRSSAETTSALMRTDSSMM